VSDFQLPEWWPFKPGSGLLWDSRQIEALHRAVQSGNLPEIIRVGETINRVSGDGDVVGVRFQPRQTDISIVIPVK